MSRLTAAAVGAGALGVAGLGLGYRLFLSETSQVAGPFPFRGPTEGRRIALTFDDGPNDPHTGDLAELLAAKGVPATFFQVGRCIERHPRRSAELHAAGHLIGNHSYRHHAADYLRPDSFLSGVARTQQLIADITGAPPQYCRTPWLHRTPTLLSAIRRSGLQCVSGRFCDPLEVLQPPPRRIAASAVRKAEPGGILIFHDGFDDRGGYRGNTVTAVGLVIDRLRDSGYEFVTVDKLLPTTSELS